MRKMSLFIFGLLVLVTVGCATNPKAGYVMEIPENDLDILMALVAFVDVGAKRGMVDYNDPDLLEIQQHLHTYTTYAYWDREWAKAKEQEHVAKYENMTDKEFATEVWVFQKEKLRFKQKLAQAAQNTVRTTQQVMHKRKVQAQFNQTTNTQVQIPNIQIPSVQVPTPSFNMNPLGNPSSTGYMINTDQGLKHGNCTTLPSGMVYCP